METLLHHPHLQRVMRALPRITTGLLIMLLAIMLATLFWQLLTPAKTLPVPPPISTKTLNNTTQTKPINYGNVVAGYHLFGQQEKQKIKPRVARPTVTPRTPLNLALLGILDRPTSTSYAIIASPKGGKQKLYSVGEEPQPGAVITRISARKVMLKRDGKLEELKLPKAKLTGSKSGSGGNANASLPKALPATELPLEIPKLPKTTLSKKGDNPEGQENEENDELSLLRDAVVNNPAKLLEIASITESKDKEGNLLGFRLSPGKNRALFRQLGLRPGDVVTTVNGVQLNSRTKGLIVMDELQSAESIDLTILRGGQEVSISKSF